MNKCNYTRGNSYSVIIPTLKKSIYPNVTEQDLINLRKLADQQEEQRVLKFKKKYL